MEKPTVFVLDDHADTTEFMRVCLAARGYCVTAAVSAEDALVQLQHMTTPCVFFLDHNLPECDPAEFIERARSINPPVHIVLMTGYNAEERALQLGIKYYLQKPFEITEFIRLVDTLAHTCEVA